MKRKIVHFRAIFYTFLAFLLGIIVAKRFYGGNVEIILISLLALGLVSAFFIYNKMFKPLAFIFAFFFIGNGFYFLGESSFNVKSYYGQVAIEGRVSDDIKDYSYAKEIVLDNVKINGENASNIRLSVTNCLNEEIEIGSKIVFEAEVEKSQPFYILQFNSKDYRAGVRYKASCSYDKIVFSDGYKMVDETVRQDIKELLFNSMSQENAGIAYAVLFGDKSDLDGEIYTSYQKSGIIHVLTVSGLHVGFLVSLFYGLLKKCRLNNWASLIITTIVIIFYTYLCGFSPSILRAGIMSICFMLSKALHRKYDSLTALGLSGFIICIINPLTALDTGFLMSFFCVFAILMLNPILAKFFKIFLPNKIASLISLSTSATLGILPFLAVMGGIINLISFAVNLIVVPVFGLLYPYLFLVCMLGTFLPFLSILLKVVDFAFIFINKIALFFSFAGATIQLSEMGLALTLIFYFILFLLGRYLMVDSLKKFSIFAASFISLVFVFCVSVLPINLNPATSVAYLFSNGQSSVVINSSNGQSVVIGESNLLMRYKNKYNRSGYDVFFSYQTISNEDVKDLSAFGVSEFITCSAIGDKGNGFVKEVNINHCYQIGAFQFEYLVSDDEILGIMFIVDKNKGIFVASSENLSYNSYEQFFTFYQPEIVIAGDNKELASGEGYTCVTIKHIEGSEYSYQKHGNIELEFNGKGWVKQNLD